MQEILEKYQVRKTNKQKTEFIEYLSKRLQNKNYQINIEERWKGPFKTKNIIVGNPDTAKYFITAHYDTQPISPFINFMFPTNVPIFLISQILTLIFIFAFTWVLSIPFAMMPISGEAYVYIYECIIFALLLWLMFGPANKHCANDNTSGTITLIKFLEKLPEKYKDKICVVFFDNEEKGLFGSQFFAKKHKDMEDKLLFNIDCVGDGKNIVFMAKKKARKDTDLDILYKILEKNAEKYNVKFIKKPMLPMMFPSDQANFDKGVGICALNKFLGCLYAGRIHTVFDTKCRENNLEYISESIKEFLEVQYEG